MNMKCILALAIAFAAPVAAQTQTSPATDDAKARSEVKAGPPAQGATRSDLFAELDRNKDGYLSRDEAKDTVWNTRFSEIDVDNDERISQSEFEALRSAASGKTK